MEFFEKSIAAHTQHLSINLAETEQANRYFEIFLTENHPAQFVHELFWRNLDPLLAYGPTDWLTVGDMHGADAFYLKKKGATVWATDLSDHHLQRAASLGMVEKFSAENVEKLRFEPETFDFVLCKESYHHFPRPALGFYEMLRVAKNAVVIQEPLDILSKMSALLALKNVLDRLSPNLIRAIWRNQYSYETVGNFVFKVSEREFEKMAAALDLPAIAFRGFHVDKSNRRGAAIELKLALKKCLSWLSLIPHEQLSTVVFKKMPEKKTIEKLKKAGYRFVELPRNPYL